MTQSGRMSKRAAETVWEEVIARGLAAVVEEQHGRLVTVETFLETRAGQSNWCVQVWRRERPRLLVEVLLWSDRLSYDGTGCRYSDPDLPGMILEVVSRKLSWRPLDADAIALSLYQHLHRRFKDLLVDRVLGGSGGRGRCSVSLRRRGPATDPWLRNIWIEPGGVRLVGPGVASRYFEYPDPLQDLLDPVADAVGLALEGTEE